MNNIVTMRQKGARYRIRNPGGHIGKPISKGFPYEVKLLNYVHKLRLKGSVIDVGAHVGNHTLYFAAICGLRVYSFEPSRDSYQQLVNNVQLNPGIRSRVQTYCMALGDEEGRASVDDKMTIIDGSDFRVAPLDDVLSVDDLSLVKIDVEGYEPFVMRGMAGHLVRNGPIVLAESHTDEAEAEQGEVMKPLGYQMKQHIRMGSRMAVWTRPRS